MKLSDLPVRAVSDPRNNEPDAAVLPPKPRRRRPAKARAPRPPPKPYVRDKVKQAAHMRKYYLLNRDRLMAINQAYKLAQREKNHE